MAEGKLSPSNKKIIILELVIIPKPDNTMTLLRVGVLYPAQDKEN